MNASSPARLALIAALLCPAAARAEDAPPPPTDDQKAAPASAPVNNPVVRGKDKAEDRGVVLIAPSEEGDLTNHDAARAAMNRACAAGGCADVTERRIGPSEPSVYYIAYAENNQSYVYGPQDDGGYAARQAIAQANLAATSDQIFRVLAAQRSYQRGGGYYYQAPRRCYAHAVYSRGVQRYSYSFGQRSTRPTSSHYSGGYSGRRWPRR